MLSVLHVTKSHFWDVVNYETYWLDNNSHRCTGQRPARTAKYLKRMKSKIKLYMFDDHSPITDLRFLDQVKRFCDSDGVSKGI